jgi:hypothetical protein
MKKSEKRAGIFPALIFYDNPNPEVFISNPAKSDLLRL